MDEIQKQFLDIVTQVRTHLELQRALGVNVVETISSCLPSPAPAVTHVSQAIKKEEHAVDKTGVDPLTMVQQQAAGCTRCGLSLGRKNVVFGEGNPTALLVFIGEAPGQEEDDQGTPFAGAAGQLLTDIIVKGMKLKREDVYVCNIVKCRPPDNRKPAPDEIKACETILAGQIEAINPKIIVALGDAAPALLNTSDGIAALRGKWQTYKGIPMMPTHDPAHLLKEEADKKLVWEDIKKVITEMKKLK